LCRHGAEIETLGRWSGEIALKTNYVLIDYENVQVKSLALLQGEQFRVRVFLGPNNKRLPIELVLPMQELGNRAEYITLETAGANALDFHIAYYLGVLATADPSAFFHIISKDTGFDPLIKHLKSRKIFSTRSASIEEMPCFVQPPANVNGSAPDAKSQGAAKKISASDRITLVVSDLIKRKAARPRTPKTLLSTLHATCGKETPPSEIEALFDQLVKRGYVKINGAKVTYELPAS
jgi:hypothetical protein